ncbi:TPA: diphosphomevalonate decarboxylase [Streptococcus suis]|uniref:diphosphomevalonate decarboxylase n=1 Tax=Streptococcus TaxID=1301 RepID=UPI001552FDA2|nr:MULTISPECIES: diphosphomevalonate decarboxylase [Streptococcus]MBM7192708.1 diphosphomevalonate decarboxylase [Streptococcus suis]MBO4112813.1 diphosphomevalonate decarboxylase [Streptococcus suis]MBY0720353.1 diphosphomevalonate decarboxylase [Streptococcus sp. 2018110]MCO8207260.1 diphosphomevalonate decarboxylase [Streptococcus suis]MCO8211725.1 diphosphomevalonate decarboxylase [Streptococcus suis]
MTKQTGIARAHTNIALIKYWGKRDKELFLPMNSSLSLTLDAFYTDTKVVFDPELTADEFYLNGILQKEKEILKISQFLDLFCEYIGERAFARVESLNFVPTAAGLASSASAFAALALATATALDLDLSPATLSTLARRGSGSSTRSLFGGFVEWDMGTGSEDSMAHPIDDADWDIAMVVLAVNTGPKKIASREGMDHTVATSPFYAAWVETAKQDLVDIKAAIANRDFEKLGQITEHNGMKMHATTLSANPPFTYWSADSLVAQEAVRQVREESGLSAYMTMDAGPNVKVLCRASQMDELVAELAKVFPREKIITSKPGPAAYVLSEDEWQASQAAFEKGL